LVVKNPVRRQEYIEKLKRTLGIYSVCLEGKFRPERSFAERDWGANLSGQFCLFLELFEIKKGKKTEGYIFEVTGVPSKIALSYSGGRNY
jgi:hypothetical protein